MKVTLSSASSNKSSSLAKRYDLETDDPAGIVIMSPFRLPVLSLL